MTECEDGPSVSNGAKKNEAVLNEPKMAQELKPCPFCASKDIQIDAHRMPNSPTGVVYSMGCYYCGATFPNRYSRQSLVDSWNTRPMGNNRGNKDEKRTKRNAEI